MQRIRKNTDNISELMQTRPEPLPSKLNFTKNLKGAIFLLIC